MLPRINKEDFNQQSHLNGIYRGVVEDRKDPDKRGRIKVRVFGVHTENISGEDDGISTEDLVWAEPVLPILEGGVSGFGQWSVPLQGSHVFVFFESGNPMAPRYFASSPGVPYTESDSKKGFNDPDGVFPTNHRLKEPDFHRLVRGEIEKTVIESRNEKIDKDVLSANGEKWSEPESYYNAEYPDNIVISTHGGIILELDNTGFNSDDKKQRIHIYHPSNSYIEIGPNGEMIIRNDSDKYEIVMQNKKIHIKCQEWTTVDKNRYKKVKMNEFIEIDEDQSITIKGNRELKIEGDYVTTVGGNYTINVKGDYVVNSDGSNEINSKKASNNKSPGKVYSVNGNVSKGVDGDEKKAITGNKQTKISGNEEKEITGDEEKKITGNSTEDITNKKTIKALAGIYLN